MHRMNLCCSTCGLLILASAASMLLAVARPAVPTPDDDATDSIISTAELRTSLERWQSKLDGRDAVIEWDYWTDRPERVPRGLTEPPVPFEALSRPGEGPGGEYWYAHNEYRILRLGERYRVQWRTKDFARTGFMNHSPYQHIAFDGENYISVIHSDQYGQADEISKTMLVYPKDDPGSEQQNFPVFAQLLTGWWLLPGPGTTARTTYLDYLETPGLEIIDHRLLEDGRTRWRITAEDWSRVYEFVAERQEGRVVLQEFVVDPLEAEAIQERFERAQREGRRGPLQRRYTYQWQWDGPEHVPSHVEVRTQRVQAAGETGRGMWVHCRVALKSIESIELPAEEFFPTPEQGMEVGDHRYGLSYTVGGRDLWIDGRLLRADRPLDGAVGRNLAKWVSKGEFVTHNDESHRGIEGRRARKQTLRLIVDSPALSASDDVLRVQAYLFASDRNRFSEPIVIIEPAGVAIALDEWRVIESGETGGRPLRLLADGTLQFDDYDGEWPVDVTAREPGGATFTLRVYGPFSQ